MSQIDKESLKRLIDAQYYLNTEEYRTLFSDRNNVENIMEYVLFHQTAKKEKGEQETERKKYLRKFTRKMNDAELQILFLRTVIMYIEDCLGRESTFSDYECAIQYSCIAAAGLDDLEQLDQLERDIFFENLWIGIYYAGEKGQKGYAYNGREAIRKYTFLLTDNLVREIAVRSFTLDADSIIKRVSNSNMNYFVQNSRMKEVDKTRFEKIDRLLAIKCNSSLEMLTNSLEKIFDGYILTNFSGENRPEWQQIVELQEKSSENRVRAWGELDVWNGSIYYKVEYEKYGYYQTKKKFLDIVFSIDWDTEMGTWRDISNASDERAYTGKTVDNVTNYLATWAGRNISDLVQIQEKELEVICFWHDDIQGRKVKENTIKVKRCFDLVHERKHNKHIFQVTFNKEIDEQSHYWVKDEEAEVVKSINILLGKNGSGKTSTMWLLRYDGLEVNAKKGLTKFFIVYKRGENCFYSTNLGEADYEIEGNLLEKGKGNISEYRGQKNRVIYYSYVLQPYEEKTELMASNTIDLSNQYIRDMEIGGISMEEMIRVDGMYGVNQKALAQRKRDYNRDSIRQLQFLYDTSDIIVKNESWLPKDVNRFVFLRCDLIESDTIIENHLSKAGLINELTGFWEYREWKVYYQNRGELQKIINACNSIIDNRDVKYFEIRLPQMSSGEKARLTLFSRLHDWISHMTSLDFRQNNILLLDELEAYMHPEWQRSMIYDLVCFFEWEHRKGKPIKVQLFISSNSPFLISDVDMDEITLMDKKIKLEEKTFAQNIHVILKDSFFKEGGYMGEYAEQKVNYVYHILSDCLKKRSKDMPIPEKDEKAARECSKIIERIGEPLIYKDLWEMYKEIFPQKNAEPDQQLKNISDEELERQINAAQEELDRRRKISVYNS